MKNASDELQMDLCFIILVLIVALAVITGAVMTICKMAQ